MGHPERVGHKIFPNTVQQTGFKSQQSIKCHGKRTGAIANTEGWNLLAKS